MGKVSSKRYAVCSANIAGMQTSRHTVFFVPERRRRGFYARTPAEGA